MKRTLLVHVHRHETRPDVFTIHYGGIIGHYRRNGELAFGDRVFMLDEVQELIERTFPATDEQPAPA